MKTLFQYILLVVCIPVFSFCEDSEEDVFAGKPFALITATDGERTSISAAVDDLTQTINLTFNKQQQISAVELDIQLNPGFQLVSPAQSPVTLDLTQPQTIRVSSKAGEVSYRLSALNEIPLQAAVLTFRDEQIEARISNDDRTITFPVESIYASEYPELLLADVPVKFDLSEGYSLSVEQTTFDLSATPTVTLTKGRNSFAYKLVPKIDYLPVKNYRADFKIQRGVNLAYWMVVGEGDRNWLGYVVPKNFPFWQELGFDHFRVPVKEDVVFNPDGSFNELAITKLHELFAWCEQNNFYALLDLHELSPWAGADSYREEDMFGGEHPEFQDHFVEVWRKLTAEFKNHDCRYLAYELLNEPGDGTDDASKWNQLQKRVLTAIRAQEPERIVFVPAMDYQNYTYIKYASIAEGDPNAVVSFHYYLPMLLSHYKMLAWKEYQGGIQYPGTVIPTQADANAYPKYASFYQVTYNASRIEGEMSNAAADGRNIGRMVHCGEFGCSKNVPETMRLAWFTDMVKAMESNQIPWTLWESLGGGFGFVDEIYGSNGTSLLINRDVLKILTGKELTKEEAVAVLTKYGFTAAQ